MAPSAPPVLVIIAPGIPGMVLRLQVGGAWVAATG